MPIKYLNSAKPSDGSEFINGGRAWQTKVGGVGSIYDTYGPSGGAGGTMVTNGSNSNGADGGGSAMGGGGLLELFARNDTRTNPEFDPNAVIESYYTDEEGLPVIETKPDLEKRKQFIGSGPNYGAQRLGAVGPEELNARFNAKMKLMDIATKRQREEETFKTDEQIRADKGIKQNTQAIAELAYSFNPVDPAFDEALKEYPANVRQASLSQPGLRSKLFKQVTDWNEAQSNNRLQNSIYKDQAARQRWLQGELDPSLAGAAIVLPAAEQAALAPNEYGQSNIFAKSLAQLLQPTAQLGYTQSGAIRNLSDAAATDAGVMRQDKLADAEVDKITAQIGEINDGNWTKDANGDIINFKKGVMYHFPTKEERGLAMAEKRTLPPFVKSVLPTGENSPENIYKRKEAERKAAQQQQATGLPEVTTRPVINQPVPIVGDVSLTGNSIPGLNYTAETPAPTAVPQVQTKPVRVQTNQPVQFTPVQEAPYPVDDIYTGEQAPPQILPNGRRVRANPQSPDFQVGPLLNQLSILAKDPRNKAFLMDLLDRAFPKQQAPVQDQTVQQAVNPYINPLLRR